MVIYNSFVFSFFVVFIVDSGQFTFKKTEDYFLINKKNVFFCNTVVKTNISLLMLFLLEMLIILRVRCVLGKCCFVFFKSLKRYLVFCEFLNYFSILRVMYDFRKTKVDITFLRSNLISRDFDLDYIRFYLKQS